MEKINKTTREDENYSKTLKEIKGSPKSLYYKGEIGLTKENCFAIVGTRGYSSYGKQIALEIAGDLAEAGLIIVSGLAPGIDTFCHQAVIERKRKTIAVLGTGLDERSIYPKSNIGLAQSILKTGGCLISEYPAGTSGTKFTFPQRNRIISGLSLGVLVIEAKPPLPEFWCGGKQKSGSGAIITACHAFKQKRKVFAVPGSIYSSNSKGCHYLIKQGAKLVENANDILKELKLPSLTPRTNKLTGETLEENLILSALKENSLYIDEIIEKTKISTADVVSTLAILEIKGKVRNLGANVYSVCPVPQPNGSGQK